jgi:hypothetical protein
MRTGEKRAKSGEDEEKDRRGQKGSYDIQTALHTVLNIMII